MNIEVSGESYEIEFTFEAAHYKKCVQKAWNYFSGASMIKEASISEIYGGESADKMMTLNTIMNAMCDVPEMVITFLYAGLLENHGDEVKTERDARALYKQFTKEHPKDERAMEFGMLNALREQMENDGFFERIGLGMLNRSQEDGAEAEKTTEGEASQK